MVPRLAVVVMASGAAVSRAGYAPCPNLCSGHGNCPLTRECECYTGWTGADCSLMTCPSGPAWTDEVDSIGGTDAAHGLAECSNRGVCDRSTGACTCEDSRFEGAACERKSCPTGCNGRGRCQTMRYFATLSDPGLGPVHTYAANWDATMMYGCHCDPGEFAPDCSLRSCPTGDDPLTGTVFDPSGVQSNEWQNVYCKANSGYAVLTFRGESTAQIPFSASEEEVQAFLEQLSTVSNAYGTALSVDNGGRDFCTYLGTTTNIRFLQDFGDLPLIVGLKTGLTLSIGTKIAVLKVTEIVAGDKEDDTCSNRGICDEDTGVCACVEYMSTSDGYGDEGQRGDCGYASQALSDCPTEESPCSMRGTCSGAPTFRCECQAGWTGADCSLMTCAKGRSWFSAPTADDYAHMSDHLVECADMGICDRATGTCECMDGFEGAACAVMSCPGDPSCNDHGQCQTVAQLALAATDNGDATAYTYGATPNDGPTWDHDMIQGCMCDVGYAGYDCSLLTCPYGDNPHTRGQLNEIQTLYCETTSTTATLAFTFRQQATAALSYATTLAELEQVLEQLSSVTDVALSADATFEDGDDAANDAAICSAAGTTTYIQFFSPTADVPIITLSKTNVVAASVTEYQKGTKEYAECSNRGICDTATGTCACFSGFGSSDGQGNKGTQADCGYVIPIFRCADGSIDC